MWILPKNYQLSSAFAQDMVESREDLTLLESSIESSLMWRSKPSPLRTWSQRWNRVSWFQRLSSRILKPSQRISFETALTLSLEDTRASRFQQQESDLEPKTPDTSGPTSLTTSRQFDLFDAFSRTSRDTSALASEKSLATWKEQVIKQRGEYSQRLKSARLTSESGFTYSVPTPTVGMEAPNKNANTKGPKNLMDVATGDWQHLVPRTWLTPRGSDTGRGEKNETFTKRMGDRTGNVYQSLPSQVHAREAKHNLWPTPASRDYRSVTGREHLQRDNHMQNLNVAAVYRQTWPTPTAHLGKEGGYPAEYTRNTPSLTAVAMKSEQKPHSSGYLNPEWVEWLMGVPTGWTGLGSWETE